MYQTCQTMVTKTLKNLQNKELPDFITTGSKALPIICEFLWGTKGVEALLELVPPKGVSDWNDAHQC